MIYTMFSGMMGWRRVLVVLLQLLMFFGLGLSMDGEIDNYLVPARIANPGIVWHFVAIAVLAAVLTAWLTRTISSVWPTLLMATAFVFMLQSFRLFTGEEYPDHRTFGLWVGAVCLAVYFVLFGLAQRMAARYKKISTPSDA